jgi:hypothetical protein
LAASSEYPRKIELPYRWRGIDGSVRLEMRENDDPAELGCPELARGFPTCRATVEPLGSGYADLFGWLQLMDLKNFTPSELVQHSGGGFEFDAFLPLGPAQHPFIYFGLAPTWFDAPHTEEDWDFRSHTFLCGLGGELHEVRREARAILGFSWGFSKSGAEIEFFGPDPLSPDDWDLHHNHLAGAFPGWKFAPGFYEHPLDTEPRA